MNLDSTNIGLEYDIYLDNWAKHDFDCGACETCLKTEPITEDLCVFTIDDLPF